MKFAESAEKQQDKIMAVIQGIAEESLKRDKTGEENLDVSVRKSQYFRVHRFVAFPGNILQPETKSGVIGCINENDLKHFSIWWQKEIIDCDNRKFVEIKGDISQIESVLRVLWATKQEVFDSSLANFDSVVYDTDKRLRDSKITFVSKKRKLPSYIFESGGIESAVVKEVNVFKDILGISYLNLFQKKAFEKKSKNLIITGCVGSGKSLILIARLLYQGLNNRQLKLLLVVFNESKLVEYKQIFENANLVCSEISEKNFNQKMWQGTVGIVHCNTKRDHSQTQSFLDELSKNVAIYVDDAHASNIALSVSNCSCLTIDYNQSHLLRN